MNFNPENYIKTEQKKLSPEKIGILKTEKSYDIFASEFIKYCMTRIDVHQNEDEFWFYNYQTNQYEQLSDARIRKIFFTIICEPDDIIWNAAIEKKYIDYFKRYVTEFQVTGYEPGILQFTNGILDFTEESPTFVDASPDYFCRFRLPYAYEKKAKCPQFQAFLKDIFEGDQERVDLIQEVMGASLYYDDFMQNLIVCLGKGSNGKSLLAKMMKHMLGKTNVAAIPIDKLSGDRFSKQNLDNKLLNISSETNANKTYSTADIKALTGGDAVEVEKKFQNAYTTEIYAKFILLANEMIKTSDYTDGFYRRLIIIPFNRQYYDLVPGQEKEEGKAYKDIYLESKLCEELPGIFNFALRGLARLRKNDYRFTMPKICVQAAERYIAEHNIIRAFANRTLVFTSNPKDRVEKPELFKLFQSFCKKGRFYKQYRLTTRQRFKEMMEDYADRESLMFTTVKSQGIYYYCGVKLK